MKSGPELPFLETFASLKNSPATLAQVAILWIHHLRLFEVRVVSGNQFLCFVFYFVQVSSLDHNDKVGTCESCALTLNILRIVSE